MAWHFPEGVGAGVGGGVGCGDGIGDGVGVGGVGAPPQNANSNDGSAKTLYDCVRAWSGAAT